MPDLHWNQSTWDGAYDWQGRGEEWSAAWGSSEAQWFGSLYPRLHRLLPANYILEIAPGFGRWTHYLLRYARAGYLGIDLSHEAIDYCRHTFADHWHARFVTNDGMSLGAAPADTFELIFSFDSLVHVELDAHARYIPQILLKLRSDGVAFIHHSNWAESLETGEPLHYRATSVSATAFAELVRQSGGHVLIQECIQWGEGRLIDCLTLFCRSDYPHIKATRRFDNRDFMQEARIIRETHLYYT